MNYLPTLGPSSTVIISKAEEKLSMHEPLFLVTHGGIFQSDSTREVPRLFPLEQMVKMFLFGIVIV